jgi:hypothetical protein
VMSMIVSANDTIVMRAFISEVKTFMSSKSTCNILRTMYGKGRFGQR